MSSSRTLCIRLIPVALIIIGIVACLNGLLRHHYQAAKPAPRAPPNCSQSVDTVDRYPVRSPQDVHSAIADIVRGHDVVEIGTRNGDSIMCFAQFASSATAIEFDAKYCEKLRRRSESGVASTNETARKLLFATRCARFQDVYVDGDYFTWWSEGPHLTNVAALMHLRRGQILHHIRANATALVVLSNGEEAQHRSSRLLKLAEWKRAVNFTEPGWHLGWFPKDGARPRHEKQSLLFPKSGTWHVVAIPLRAVDVEALVPPGRISSGARMIVHESGSNDAAGYKRYLGDARHQAASR